MSSKRRLIAFAVGGLSMIAGPVLAGPCTDQIAQFDKQMASSDAGSGPTGSIANKPLASGSGGAQAPDTSGAHPPTARMNQAAGDKATSPADVRAQTQGQDTAVKGGSPPLDQAMQALARARTADAQGNAADCNAALNEAKRAYPAK
jgi:hypothetical protein